MQFRTIRNHHFMFHLHEMISMFRMQWNYERATPFAAFRSARQQDKERIQSELGECFLYILDTWWMQDGPPTSLCTSLFPTSLAAGSGWISSWPSHWTHDGLVQLTCGTAEDASSKAPLDPRVPRSWLFRKMFGGSLGSVKKWVAMGKKKRCVDSKDPWWPLVARIFFEICFFCLVCVCVWVTIESLNQLNDGQMIDHPTQVLTMARVGFPTSHSGLNFL
jgi:hypothetical protein